MSTLLLVHAHPDDEAISTGGVMRRAHEEGRRVVLLTATRGEEGEIHNMDEASVRPRLGEVRTEELRRACEILGVDRQEFLGYRDSGMIGTPANENPVSFHRAHTREAAERIAAVMREERPDVVVTYGADGIYGHPDHVKAHHATVAALDLLELEGWQPAKFYYTVVPRSGLDAVGRMLEEQLGQNPFADGVGAMVVGTPDEEITTVVDTSAYFRAKADAFAAYVSQNDPEAIFRTAAGLIYELMLSTEHYVLARGARGDGEPEPDLFTGI